MSRAVFDRDGDAFLPDPISRARWYDEVLHGGPVAALFARQIEAMPGDVPTTVARLTVDLMRPVPVAPLTVSTRMVREGRRIQVIDAEMSTGGRVVARASALRMRVGDIDPPTHPRRSLPEGPDGLAPATWEGGDDDWWFHTRGVEMRFVEGAFRVPGPAAAWIRLVVPLVAGEETSPLQRAAAIADFGNGVSQVVGSGWWFINADLTVALARPPVGEWILLRSRSDLEGSGTGLAQSEMFDRTGAFGHALQSLFVEQGADADF